MVRAIRGESLARFGDGEINIIHGKDARYQRYTPDVASELKDIIRLGEHCMIGVPGRGGIRDDYWSTYLAEHPIPERDYVSAFVSRPDEIDVDLDKYRSLVRWLWKDKNVLVVTGSLHESMLPEALWIDTIHVPARDAYKTVDALEAEIMNRFFDLCILSAGATATCLAYRLSRRGRHAVDLGNLGKFL